jgi:hypothetical protein
MGHTAGRRTGRKIRTGTIDQEGSLKNMITNAFLQLINGREYAVQAEVEETQK